MRHRGWVAGDRLGTWARCWRCYWVFAQLPPPRHTLPPPWTLPCPAGRQADLPPNNQDVEMKRAREGAMESEAASGSEVSGPAALLATGNARRSLFEAGLVTPGYPSPWALPLRS